MVDEGSPEPLWTAEEIEAAVGGRLRGPPFVAGGLDIDSRQIAPGELFIALTAARDGHDFVDGARARGAVAALASRPVSEPYVLVGDTLAALGALAAAARERAKAARRGAVTGSVGKTSVTQAVLAGLRRAGGGHGSVKSFNNHIGVPLTLARMPRHTRAAVFEMGMNHAGEIAPLSALVRPHAVAVTTVEAAHVENFPDGEAGVARAKAEIFEGLEPGGAAILNADNRWFDALEARARTRGARVLTFGEASGCEARLLGFELTRTGARVDAELHGAAISYDLHHRARHWGPMSLCALLMMGELGVALETALGALADLRPLAGRGAERILTIDGGEVVLIDESYNASPVSVRAALQSLGERPAAGRRIAALTDMLELGPDGPDQHVALAQAAQSSGVNLVFCAGPLMLRLYEAIDPTRRGGYAQDAEALAAVLAPALEPGDVVMVKGSHASRASVIVERLAAGASAARDEA